MFLWMSALTLLLALQLFAVLYRHAVTKHSQAFLFFPNPTLVTRALGSTEVNRLPFFFYLTAFNAAREILNKLPAETAVGLATFNNYDTLSVPLTLEHDKVSAGLDLLNQGGGYVFTHVIIAALQTFPLEESEEQIGAIILFSHGHDNSGNNPLELADEAVKRGIQIHTVGVGTHGNNFSEDLLQIVAERTGGRYYPIYSAEDLSNAHKDLARVVALKPERVEVSAFAALFAAFLLMASLLLGTLQRKVI